MRIGDSLAVPDNQQANQVGSGASSQSQGPADRPGLSSDEVRIFVDGGKVQQLKANLSGLQDSRQEKVSALKQSVNNGTYHVSNEQIANALYSHMTGGHGFGT
jgi:flagellar biosynthesis anti-sigma factor FlgM